MEWPASLVIVIFALFILAAAIVLIVEAWKEWCWTVAPTRWRKWVAMGGLICGSLGAIAVPVALLMQFQQARGRVSFMFAGQALSLSVLCGFCASILGIPLAAFASGKVRWLAIPACVLSALLCYGAILGLEG